MYHVFIDGSGRVMLHPLLTAPVDIPRELWFKDPVFLDITTIEKTSVIDPVVTSMRR